MKNDGITLWLGDEGIHLDSNGNIYSVSKKDNLLEEGVPVQDLLSIYRSILDELGVKIEVDEFPAVQYPNNKFIRYTFIYNGKSHLPFRRSFAFRCPE